MEYQVEPKKVAVVERFKQESVYGVSIKKVAVVERFKQESVYGVSIKKSGCCREMSVSGGWTLLLIFVLKAHNIFSMQENIFS